MVTAPLNAKVRALVIDDDEDVCQLYHLQLEQIGGFEATSVLNGKEALKRIQEVSFDLILIDLVLGYENGLEVMQEILSVAPLTRAWVLTGNGSIEAAVDAMRSGASGFFSKTDDPKKIVQELSAAFLSESKRTLYDVTLTRNPEEYGIIGTSPAILHVIENIDRMKEVDSTILIFGESGTGKELIARALHRASSRGNSHFAGINCGAIPENLLESELFGHKRGAFTDAKTDRKGMFELCTQGTLLLDEIGEMPLSLQVKLLRVLQEKEIRPVGSSQTSKIDTRVIASTNKNLEEEVKSGRFREDLFYRLSVLRIQSPPLRERREDIPLLVEYFLMRFNERFRKKVMLPGSEILARLISYPWPGNIRELQNAIERAVVLTLDNKIHLEHLFHSIPPKAGQNVLSDVNLDDTFSLPLTHAKQKFERAYLLRLLKMTKGNISETARIACQHRPRIYKLLRKYEINTSEFKH